MFFENYIMFFLDKILEHAQNPEKKLKFTVVFVEVQQFFGRSSA